MIVGITSDWHIRKGLGINKTDPETGRDAWLDYVTDRAQWVTDDMAARNVDVILNAGDLYHSNRPGATEISQGLSAIPSGIDTLLIVGNHDVLRGAGEISPPLLGRLLDGTSVAERPQVVRLPDPEGPWHAECIQVACLPYPNKGWLLSQDQYRNLPPAEANAVMREALRGVLQGLAAEIDPDIPSCLLAHVTISGAETGRGYTMLGNDIEIGLGDIPDVFSQCFFGHIHKPQQMADNVWIVGSHVQQDHGEESYEPRYLLWDTESNAIESVPIPGRRFRTIDLDLRGGYEISPLGSMDLDGDIVRYRVVLDPGQTLDEAALRKAAEVSGAWHVTIQRETARTDRLYEGHERAAGDSDRDRINAYSSSLETPLSEDVVAGALEICGEVA